MRAYVSRSESSRDDWETPLELFSAVNSVFRFNLDAAASCKNKLCEHYLRDAFVENWAVPGEGTRVWCNPPYSEKTEFIKRALEFTDVADCIVFLLPNNSRETEWWNKLVVPNAEMIINLVGRVNYNYQGIPSSGCTFPSCLAVFRPRLRNAIYSSAEVYWAWKVHKI